MVLNHIDLKSAVAVEKERERERDNGENTDDLCNIILFTQIIANAQCEYDCEQGSITAIKTHLIGPPSPLPLAHR